MPALELIKALATDTTDTAAFTTVATITEPAISTAGVFKSNGEVLQILPYGTGADNSTSVFRVLGYQRMSSGLAVTWIPRVIASFSVTLSTFVGLATSSITASHRFADTITLTTGIAVIPSVPAETPAWVVVDVSEFEYFKIETDLGTATAANYLITRS